VDVLYFINVDFRKGPHQWLVGCALKLEMLNMFMLISGQLP
jgi:hypothetical protein